MPQSLMLKYPINCKSSHNHILDLNNSLKMHGLVCILGTARREHRVPIRYTIRICDGFFFLLCISRVLLFITKPWNKVGDHSYCTQELPLMQPSPISVRNIPAESLPSSKKKKEEKTT